MIHTAAVLTAVGVYREAAARPPASIVVRRGDSLSGIAARYHIEWPVAPASPASATTDPVAGHAISAGPAAPAGSFQQCVIAIRIDGPKAWSERLSIGRHFTDAHENYRMELSNGALIHYPTTGNQAADLTVTLTRPQLLQLLATAKPGGIDMSGDQLSWGD